MRLFFIESMCVMPTSDDIGGIASAADQKRLVAIELREHRSQPIRQIGEIEQTAAKFQDGDGHVEECPSYGISR